MGRTKKIVNIILLSATALAAVEGSLFPSTIDGFSSFLVFDTPILMSGKPIDASNYNLVWGASDLLIPMYKETNPNIVVAHYMPWARDPEINSLQYWQQTKPEWVMYQCDKVTPAFLFKEDKNIPFDISNQEVIDWQIERYVRIVKDFGYNGIAADNFAVGNAYKGCGVWKDGVWIQKYSGAWEDPNYTRDALAWLTYFYDHLKTNHPEISFGINYSLNEMPPNDVKVMSVVDHTDYVVDEAGFTRWGEAKPTAEKWEEINQWIENIQNEGKHYFGINEFPGNRITDADHEWGMASYLMSKNQASTMVNTLIQGYGIELFLENYANLNIGQPMAKRYLENGLWKRKYSNGFVIVNPFLVSQTVTLPDDGFKYKDVYGQEYGPGKSFTVAAQTGLVMGATQRPPTTITISSTSSSSTTSSSSSSSSSSSGGVGVDPSASPSPSSSPSSSSSSPSSSDNEPSTSSASSIFSSSLFSSSLAVIGGVAMWMLL